MRRWILLLAILAACEAPVKRDATPPVFVYPPLPTAWTGVPRGTIGRGQAPQLVAFGGITGSASPLRDVRVFQVPGPGPARAIVDGISDKGARAIELVDIDAGRVLWRDSTRCAGEVQAVTASTIVCSQASVLTVAPLDGQDPSWTFSDPDLGYDEVIAACSDRGRELFLVPSRDVVRIAERDGKLVPTWTAPLPNVTSIVACDGPTVVIAATFDGTPVVVALDRETGKETGRIVGGRGVWTARDGSPRVEVATESAVVRVARDLSGPREALEAVRLGRHIATFGAHRLVSASATTAVLLDPGGVRAFIPIASERAALGGSSIVHGTRLRRLLLPARETRALRIAKEAPAHIAVPAALRDLPPIADATGTPLELEAATAQHAIVANGQVFVVTGYDKVTEGPRSTDVATFDLRSKTWGDSSRQLVGQDFVGFAVVKDTVFAATRGDGEDTIVTNMRTRKSERYRVRGSGMQATGDVVLWDDGDRVVAFAGTATAIIASDDGGSVAAAVLEVGGATVMVTAERNCVVARLPGAQMMPMWSLDVNGTVAAITAAGDGVLVELADGDAYRIDARTGDAVSLAGIGTDWRVAGDLITLAGAGGPIPVAGWPPPPAAPAKAPAKKGAKKTAKADKTDDDIPRPPRLVTPVAVPADLQPSWQYTLFDLAGALRARNDYALVPAGTPAALRTAGAPLVVLDGARTLAIVLDPATGDPVRHVRLPSPAGIAFSTLVDGKPVVGALLSKPLRVLLF